MLVRVVILQQFQVAVVQLKAVLLMAEEQPVQPEVVLPELQINQRQPIQEF